MKFKPPHELTTREFTEEVIKCCEYLHSNLFLDREGAALAIVRLTALLGEETGEPLERVIGNAISDDMQTSGIAAIMLWEQD